MFSKELVEYVVFKSIGVQEAIRSEELYTTKVVPEFQFKTLRRYSSLEGKWGHRLYWRKYTPWEENNWYTNHFLWIH